MHGPAANMHDASAFPSRAMLVVVSEVPRGEQ